MDEWKDKIKGVFTGDMKVIVTVVIVVIIILIIFFIWRRSTGAAKNRGNRNKDGSSKDESSSSHEEKGKVHSIKEEHKKHEVKAPNKDNVTKETLNKEEGKGYQPQKVTGSMGVTPKCSGNCGTNAPNTPQVNNENKIPYPSNPAHIRERSNNYQVHDGNSRIQRLRTENQQGNDEETKIEEETPKVKSVRFSTKNDDE